MSGLTPFKFEFYRGLPPNGAGGQFWGFDSDMNSYLLRWNLIKGCWDGIGFDPNDRSKALLFFTKPGDSLIVAWSPAPLTKEAILGKARTNRGALLGVEPLGSA